MIVTGQLITQSYLVPEISKQLLHYDRLRWYRSETGQNGYFSPITAETAQPATLMITPVTRALADRTLELRVHSLNTVFVPLGPDPVELGDIADRVVAAAPDLLRAEVVFESVMVETVATGTAASIEVRPSAAAPYLGLYAGQGVAGFDADTVLLPEQSEYLLADYQSSPGRWYMVTFRSSESGVTSSPSAAFLSRAEDSVPWSKLVGSYVRLCDLAGRPLPGRRIFIHNVFQPNRVELTGRAWGVFRQYEEMITDQSGYAETRLLRGAVVDVTVAGTGFTRRVTIPAAATIVDLLDPALTDDDEFGVQTLNIDFAIRTTR